MKKVRKILSAALFAFALLLIAPAVLPGYSNTENVQAAVITRQRTLVKGSSVSVSITNASSATWTSSNTSVATVTKSNTTGTKAIIKANAKGSAVITGKSGKAEVKYLINVATMNYTSIVRAKNGSYTLKISGVPSSNSVKWSITDSKGNSTSVASLSSATASSVKVTGKAAGTAYVKITLSGKDTDGKTWAFKQTCTKVKVEELYLSKTNIGLTKGNSYTLSILNKATGKATTRTVKWSSSNTSIATVTSTGKVTAKAKGSAYIYASVAGVKYKCQISVSNPLTAADYMKNLKSTIQKSSKVNSSGNHYIARSVKNSDGSSKYYYYVVYEKAKDRLNFKFSRKDTDSSSKRSATINMYIYSPDKSYNAVTSLTITTKKGLSFKTKRTFNNYRNYNNGTDYKYTVTKHNLKTLTSAYKNSMVSLSNDYMQIAMKGWNTLLSKNGFTMKQIGFTKF